MFWQVGKLKGQYEEWVHAPCTTNFRMFESDFVEFFSETKWWVIPLVWIPVCFWLSYTALQSDSHPLSTAMFARCFVFGIGLWTFTEYSLHRFLFHALVSSKSAFWITAHFVLHGQHHKFPMDKGRLVFPPVAACPFLFLIYSGLQLLLPPAHAKVIIAGLLLAYIFYDLTHYYLHHGTSVYSWFSSLKKSHMLHHYKNQKLGFGISTRFWDTIYGTSQPILH